MKSYKQHSEAQDPKRQWIIDAIEKTEKPHDQIKAEFLAKYGKQDKGAAAYFDKVVHEIVD